jgi:hypothetical protein
MQHDPSVHHPGFPARAALRPGVRVARRSATELQVGLATDHAVVIPDDAGVRLVLRGLDDGHPPPPPGLLSPAARRACELLLAHDLVVDADVWCTTLHRLEGAAAAARSALVAEVGDAAASRLAQRRTVCVGLTATGLGAAADQLHALLAMAGIATATGTQADVVAVLTEGEPERSLLDELVAAERPHACLVVCEGRVRVGPFVHPGRTACQRCLDASAAETDPRHGLVLEQYAGPSRPLWGLAGPVPADLVALGTALLARDLTRWADVLQPATWSTTIEVDPALTLPRTTWSRPAACG